MKFFAKLHTSSLVITPLSYTNTRQKPEIARVLRAEQFGFCAYTERFICETDSAHIEHFDPRKKGTADDNYYNWYLTIAWINLYKDDKIVNYQPLLEPVLAQGEDRITYNVQTNLFIPVDPNDIEADNLIKFLGFNKLELYNDRIKHIDRANDWLSMVGNDIDQLYYFLEKDKWYVSFSTAMEKVFNINLEPIIQRDLQKMP